MGQNPPPLEQPDSRSTRPLRGQVMHGKVVILRIFALGALCFTSVYAQQQPGSSSAAAAALEFPVVMQQNVIAGKTPVGTKVQAKLTVATMVEGTVVPRNAVFSGEVTESVAKTKTDPSRLAVRMDSLQWKGGSAAVKVYLTPWYYPVKSVAGQDLQYGPTQPANKTWNGQGQYPDPNSRVYQPFPGGNSDQNSSVPTMPTSVTSDRRVPMKNVSRCPAPTA
jgi:hypothetical protein